MNHFGIISMLPAVVALGMAIWTKRVVESLLAGIFIGVFIIKSAANGFFDATIFSINNTFAAIVGYAPNPELGLLGMGSLKDAGRIETTIVVLLLGAFIAILEKSGSANAFGDWLSKKIKTKNGAQNSSAIMGCCLFTSAYFSSLATGTVFRSIFDKQKISRARLAFILDSTSAPINTLIPISGWVAYMALLLEENIKGVAKGEGIVALVKTVPFNFYCIIMLIIVFLFANGIIKSFGPMKKSDKLAAESEELSISGECVSEENELFHKNMKKGKVSDMMYPLGISIITLFVLGLWNYTVANFFPVPKVPFGGNQMLILSFSLGLIVAFVKYTFNGLMTRKEFLDDALEGTKSAIMGAMIILLAVTIGDLLRSPYPEGLGAINFIETFASNIPSSVIPVGVFLLSAFMGFSMGASWGVWAIMIPLGVSMTVATGGDFWPQILTAAAVLSGGTFGDHCSPISDTTIMSSIGSGCNHIEHVNTQIPYALVAALIASVFFFISGFIV
jgi:tetracycline resistance efflux pump